MTNKLKIIRAQCTDTRFSRAFKVARDQDKQMLGGYVGNAYQHISSDDISGIFLQRGKKPKVWLSTYAGKDMVYEPVGPDLYVDNLRAFWDRVQIIEKEEPMQFPLPFSDPEPVERGTKELPEALNLSTVLGRLKVRTVLADRTIATRPRFEDLTQWGNWAVSLGYELYLVRKE